MYTFPFATKQIKEGEIVIPRIFLQAKTLRGHQEVRFLVDSGADVTSLPIHPFVSLLQAKLDRKNRTVIGGIGSKGVAAYPITIEFSLGNLNFNLQCFFLASEAEPLLGRLDFWKLFSITFDNKKHQTTISPV